MGRPSKLTPEVEARLVELLSQGNTRATAARAAGLDYSTLKRWLARGARAGDDPEDEPFRALCAALKKAEALAFADAVATIKTASQTTWQAAAWFLERRAPEDWGRDTQRVADLERQLRELEASLAPVRPTPAPDPQGPRIHRRPERNAR